MTGVTYDSGALIAAERGERRIWVRHRALLLRRVVPTVPAPVVAGDAFDAASKTTCAEAGTALSAATTNKAAQARVKNEWRIMPSQ